MCTTILTLAADRLLNNTWLEESTSIASEKNLIASPNSPLEKAAFPLACTIPKHSQFLVPIPFSECAKQNASLRIHGIPPPPPKSPITTLSILSHKQLDHDLSFIPPQLRTQTVTLDPRLWRIPNLKPRPHHPYKKTIMIHNPPKTLPVHPPITIKQIYITTIIHPLHSTQINTTKPTPNKSQKPTCTPAHLKNHHMHPWTLKHLQTKLSNKQPHPPSPFPSQSPLWLPQKTSNIHHQTQPGNPTPLTKWPPLILSQPV